MARKDKYDTGDEDGPAAVLAEKLPMEIGIQQRKRSFERWLDVPYLSRFEPRNGAITLHTHREKPPSAIQSSCG